jgi:Ser/Thr protein kinase RdoA (MazF antagonist)
MDCTAARTHQATRAAQAVARRYGLPSHQSRVLHDANNVVVHLAPSPVVAKICRSTLHGRGRLAAELEAALHLDRLGAPIVPPSHELPVQPYEEDGYAVTFWQHHAHDPHATVSEIAAGRALADVHRALDTFAASSRSFMDRRARRTAEVLAGHMSLPTLSESELRLLQGEYLALISSVRDRRFECRVLHGDPHQGNVLVAKNGCLVIDFESICSGPLEWDLSALPGGGAGVFTVDDELLSLLRKLRSLCVAVWCLSRSQLSAELESAARRHLNWLRASSCSHHGLAAA